MSMKWSDPIIFDHPLRSVALLAEAPVASWESLLKDREAAAYQNGQRDAELSLNAQFLQQKNQFSELQSGVLTSLNNAISQVIQESQTALIQLALEAASRIVADTPVDANMVGAVVRDALRQVEDSAELLVQLNPEDLALLRDHNADLLKGLPEKGPMRFAASPQVSRGGCLVQTRFGVIDARREVKLQQLADSLSA